MAWVWERIQHRVSPHPSPNQLYLILVSSQSTKDLQDLPNFILWEGILDNMIDHIFCEYHRDNNHATDDC